jgi:hypothetical protein
MKAILLVAMVLVSTSVWSNDLGVGVSIGNPTGLNGKYWLDGDHAIDGGFAWSLGKHSDLSIHSDYLFHKEGAFFFNDVNPLDLYYGIGGRMEFEDEIDLGVRIPVGLAHKVENGKADIFGEVAPIVDFIGTTGVELHILFGGRYYF